jgi:hypothetical protein
MKKIIPSSEAVLFACPLAMGHPQTAYNACLGSACMKWGEETMLQKKADYIAPPKGSIFSPLTGYEEVPTGKGFCGL